MLKLLITFEVDGFTMQRAYLASHNNYAKAKREAWNFIQETYGEDGVLRMRGCSRVAEVVAA